MIEIIKETLLELNEQKLFDLFKRINRFRTIKRRSENKMDYIDWYIEKLDLYIEGKCRKADYGSYLIEKHKYDELIKNKNCWYVSSGGNGIYAWDMHKYTEAYGKINFQTELHNDVTEFGEPKKILKDVHYLNISYAYYLTAELLLYPFHKNDNPLIDY